MEENIEVITLDNGLDYIILDEISSDSNTYVYLANTNDENDLCIRKIELDNGEKFLVGLDDDKEFDKALSLYHHVHQNDQ